MKFLFLNLFLLCFFGAKAQADQDTRETESQRIELYIKDTYLLGRLHGTDEASSEKAKNEYIFRSELCFKDPLSGDHYGNIFVHVLSEEIDVGEKDYYTNFKGCLLISMHLDYSLFKPSQKCSVPVNLRILEPMPAPVHITLDLNIPKDFDACWN